MALSRRTLSQHKRAAVSEVMVGWGLRTLQNERSETDDDTPELLYPRDGEDCCVQTPLLKAAEIVGVEKCSEVIDSSHPLCRTNYWERLKALLPGAETRRDYLRVEIPGRLGYPSPR